jgi:hypothetical protein
MRRAAIALFALGALVACSEPPARSASYFKEHPEETGKVLIDCTAGTHRGAECDNAKAAEAEVNSDKRLSLYKKSF